MRCYWDDETAENKLGQACSTHGRDDNSQHYGLETQREGVLGALGVNG